MIDEQETRRAVAAIAVVGQIDGHDVIRRSSVLEVVQRREKDIIYAEGRALEIVRRR